MSEERKDRFERRLRSVQSFHAKFSRKRNRRQRFADTATTYSGTTEFLIFHAIWFAIWIVWNGKFIPAIKPFDPFPFVLLTTIVSIEAIFLAIIVLISQNRQSRIAELREEVDLQINMIAEEEITKLMQMVAGLYKFLNVEVPRDSEIREMLKRTDPEEIERELEEQLETEVGEI